MCLFFLFGFVCVGALVYLKLRAKRRSLVHWNDSSMQKAFVVVEAPIDEDDEAEQNNTVSTRAADSANCKCHPHSIA
jgi:hypothetical protein